jgi:hypothetical protein
MSYRGIPLRGLLSALPSDLTDTIQARAADGFVAEIPHALISGAAVPWIALEDASHPWPALQRKAILAGPFYLVWEHPERARISPEQWVFALAALTAVPSPMQRWPAVAVDASVPEDAPARRGQVAFIANCLPCHRLGGAGEATVGPDLLRPVPATCTLPTLVCAPSSAIPRQCATGRRNKCRPLRTMRSPTPRSMRLSPISTILQRVQNKFVSTASALRRAVGEGANARSLSCRSILLPLINGWPLSALSRGSCRRLAASGFAPKPTLPSFLRSSPRRIAADPFCLANSLQSAPNALLAWDAAGPAISCQDE